MIGKELHIDVFWGEEACVWVATSEDVPGLVTEADTQEDLMKKLRVMVPELLELNGVHIGREIPIEVSSKRKELLHLALAC